MEDLLPHSIIYREKMGFPTPWGYWLAGTSLEELRSLLLEARTVERGLFRTESVKRLFDQHAAGRRDHGNRIWRLLNLELWLRVCVDGDTDAGFVSQARAVTHG
jgi:asparagine synthase (glutamine-hydrolysing)